MKRSPRYSFPYRTKPFMSNPDLPWVIIKFPSGLNGLPVVYPCGNTHEETEKVREFIEKALNRVDPGSRG